MKNLAKPAKPGALYVYDRYAMLIQIKANRTGECWQDQGFAVTFNDQDTMGKKEIRFRSV